MAFHIDNPADISALTTELTTDPQAIGYAPFVANGAHGTLAFMLNDLGTYSVLIDVAVVSSAAMQGAVDAAEWDARSTNALLQWLTLITIVNGVPTANANIKAQVQAIWPPGSATRTALGALQEKNGTRAEELWGDGSSVSTEAVRVALT